MQRVKGATFERLIANKMREEFPHAVWRRSRQSDGAHHSDVYCHEGPENLKRLWLECNHANKPNPKKKMEQAMRDIGKRDFVPVVVWRRTKERALHATVWLRDLSLLSSVVITTPTWAYDTLITLDFSDLIFYVSQWSDD